MAMLLWAAWFFRQWRCLDTIMERFRERDGQKPAEAKEPIDVQEGWALPGAQEGWGTLDVQETRESRLVSDMLQILGRAAWREQEAVRGRQQVMEVLSDLSHQLKTPLANIILDIELLESEQGRMEEEQRKEFLSHAREQAATMQWLMQCLLKASRLEEGSIQFQAEDACIRPTIARAVGAVYAQAKNRHMEICVEEVGDILLYHNPKWTAEAMANVLENAVKYSPEGSRIRIYMDKMDIYTRITVQDQGPGIPESEYNKIFQRFYRGKQAEAADTENAGNGHAAEGMGLGLYLAQLILHGEQGYLTVDAKENRGSKFHFFLLNAGAGHNLTKLS